MTKSLEQSEVIDGMPAVCADELAAVEFFERQMWGGTPKCAHCQSASVYQMKDAKTGGRNKRFLWRCHACKNQFTVRIGTVLEETRIPLRHWAYAMWRMATSKKGVAALEIRRHCQITYRAALFLLHRIRFAMTPENGASQKLTGIVECDETYVGGKPRQIIGSRPRRSGPRAKNDPTAKTPVLGMVERGGRIQRRVMPKVSSKSLKGAIKECVDPSATISTDEMNLYRGIGNDFKGGHITVNHGCKQYVLGNASTNTAESSFAILKRGLHGIYHSVSKKHLHRYVGEFDFRWNTRKVCDGDRITAAVQGAVGKRLTYKAQTR
jgi:transposase-like protein